MHGTDSEPSPPPAGEVTLLASFDEPEPAQRAAQALRAAGFDIVQVADSGASSGARAGEPLVEWGRHGYQMEASDDKWTSAAAWANPWGLDLGGGILLTAVVPSAERARAAAIIETAGGRL